MSAHPQAGAFLRAAYEGKIDMVLQMIEEEGVPVNVENQTGLQALHFAAKRNNVELADELLKHGAKVNCATLKGNTPLHVGALMGHAEIIKLLLRSGAEVNQQSDCHGELFTPLYMAAQIGNQEIVMLLLAQGADPSVRTKNGSTAHDVAVQQGHQIVSELLSEYERRMRKGSQGDDQGEEKKQAEEPEEAAAAGGEEEGASGGDSGNGRKKIGPPPVCTDVCASPRNSPKHMHRKLEIHNGQHKDADSAD